MKYFEEWVIAYRKRVNGSLLTDDPLSAFQIIPNTWRYWCADPHLYTHNNRTYVFAELYDRILRRGLIGCCEITDSGCTPWQVVLKMPWHLSYPHVFDHQGHIYMIPESYSGQEIAVYESTEFPRKWKKIHVLKKDCVAVDSTLFVHEGKPMLFTMEEENNVSQLMLYHIHNGHLVDGTLAAEDNGNVRPAGKLLTYRNKLIRPAQDCTEGYGCALNFYEITELSKDTYDETLLVKIYPESIRSDLGHQPAGIHTYNANDKYEVIDLKEYSKDPWAFIMRPIWFLWRRIKKLTGRYAL